MKRGKIWGANTIDKFETICLAARDAVLQIDREVRAADRCDGPACSERRWVQGDQYRSEILGRIYDRWTELCHERGAKVERSQFPLKQTYVMAMFTDFRKKSTVQKEAAWS